QQLAQARRDVGLEAAPARAADQRLVDLQLDAAIARLRMPLAQPGRETVAVAAVRIVVPQPQRRIEAVQDRSPFPAQRLLALALAVVEEADLRVAHLAVELGREAVHGDVHDGAARRGRRGGALDGLAMRPPPALEDLFALLQRQALGEARPDARVGRRAVGL